jgi:hypothetical protein
MFFSWGEEEDSRWDIGISLSGVEHRADFLVRIVKENNFTVVSSF